MGSRSESGRLPTSGDFLDLTKLDNTETEKLISAYQFHIIVSHKVLTDHEDKNSDGVSGSFKDVYDGSSYWTIVEVLGGIKDYWDCMLHQLALERPQCRTSEIPSDQKNLWCYLHNAMIEAHNTEFASIGSNLTDFVERDIERTLRRKEAINTFLKEGQDALHKTDLTRRISTILDEDFNTEVRQLHMLSYDTMEVWASNSICFAMGDALFDIIHLWLTDKLAL
ncbi:hypothetical protein HYFRA_00000207 [Hymenoscyphus fraxineus]|uniref:Uncharacterized protein n=1 Tax=Hymenoscyphus fraxineus TaxID=746836 RepID=A0A9N9L6F8_9HELO|nr:hypothetical protein HYFRA_00000207 [Hymenoscyphus fraxineus]